MKNSITIFICQFTCAAHLSFKNTRTKLTHIFSSFFLLLNWWTFPWKRFALISWIYDQYCVGQFCWSSFCCCCQMNNLSKKVQFVRNKTKNIILKAPSFSSQRQCQDDDDDLQEYHHHFQRHHLSNFLSTSSPTSDLDLQHYAIESNYRTRTFASANGAFNGNYRERD